MQLLRPSLMACLALSALACEKPTASDVPPPLPAAPATVAEPGASTASAEPEPRAPAEEPNEKDEGAAPSNAETHEAKADEAAQAKAKTASKASKDTDRESAPAQRGVSLYTLQEQGVVPKPAPVATTTTTNGKTTTPTKAPTTTPTPAPTTTPAPAKTVTGKVTIPTSNYISVSIPSGLQADLNKDTRMQSWLNQVMKVLDTCYSGPRAAGATGTIAVTVTMHENERPDADVNQLPPALSSMVACATGKLMRVKMPLFTGKEGTRYPVRISFKP